MEFVELLLLCVAVLLLIFKPEQEKLAWWLTIGGWAVVVFMYVGHVSTAILGPELPRRCDSQEFGRHFFELRP